MASTPVTAKPSRSPANTSAARGVGASAMRWVKPRPSSSSRSRASKRGHGPNNRKLARTSSTIAPGHCALTCELWRYAHAARKRCQRASAEASCSPSATSDSSACRSEEHTSELQSLMRIPYAVLCLDKEKRTSNLSYDHTLLVTPYNSKNDKN